MTSFVHGLAMLYIICFVHKGAKNAVTTSIVMFVS